MLEDKIIDNLEATSIFYIQSMEATATCSYSYMGADINNLKPPYH